MTAIAISVGVLLPIMPGVERRSAAIGVSKLIGMNSDAINMATHIAMVAAAAHVRLSGAAIPASIVCLGFLYVRMRKMGMRKAGNDQRDRFEFISEITSEGQTHLRG